MNDTAAANANGSMNEWPWTQPAWRRTAGALDALHHGLLITGAPGVAKREFALGLSQLLLCAEPHEQQPCGRCRNCALFAAGTHPDFHVLTTELEWRDGRIELAAQYCNRYQDVGARDKRANPSKVIPVDQVRLLIERFSVHAHSAARKVALIMPADRMNANAANALLKLLEEPPDDSFLILVSALPGHLPPTVRSRCMSIPIPPPRRDDAREWLRARVKADANDIDLALALAHGAPLDALRMHQDGFLAAQREFLRGLGALAAGRVGALELAAQFAKHDFAQWLDWLHRFGCELIRARCTGAPPRWRAEAELDCARLPVERLFALYDRIGYYRRIAREPLNAQLATEELTLGLQRLLRA